MKLWLLNGKAAVRGGKLVFGDCRCGDVFRAMCCGFVHASVGFTNGGGGGVYLDGFSDETAYPNCPYLNAYTYSADGQSVERKITARIVENVYKAFDSQTIPPNVEYETGCPNGDDATETGKLNYGLYHGAETFLPGTGVMRGVNNNAPTTTRDYCPVFYVWDAWANTRVSVLGPDDRWHEVAAGATYEFPCVRLLGRDYTQSPSDRHHKFEVRYKVERKKP